MLKGAAAPETKAAAEQARLLIEKPKQSESLPKTRCCFLCSLRLLGRELRCVQWSTLCRELATQFLALAEKQER